MSAAAHDLTANGVATPLGLDLGPSLSSPSSPTLAWQLPWDPTWRDVRQTSAQVQVATAADFASVLWDSGAVTTDQPRLVYAGPALTSSTRYYWRVQVGLSGAHSSGWSATTWFETGLLAQSDWNPSAWIQVSGLLRRTFAVPGTTVVSARLYMGGAAPFVATVNGRRLGDTSGIVGRPLQAGDPYLGYTRGEVSKRALYSTIDITALVTTGDNMIAFQGGTFTPTSLRAIVLVTSRLADGTLQTTRVNSDTSSWQTRAGGGSLTLLAGNEVDDPGLNPAGWNLVGASTTGWTTATALLPTTQTTDVAKGLTPTIVGGSVESGGFAAAQLTDGVIFSRAGLEGFESTPTTDKSTATSITLDLGGVHTLDRVMLYPSEPSALVPAPAFGFPITYRVEADTDPSFPNPIVLTMPSPAPVNSRVPRQFFGPAGSKIRYVRVVSSELRSIDSNGNFAMALAELSVWETTPATTLMEASIAPPVRVVAVHAPVGSSTVTTPSNETGQMFDFGTAMAGIGQITIPAGVSGPVKLEYFESLDANGTPFQASVGAQFSTFTAHGTATTWSPELQYFAFRYVVVVGLTNPLASSAINALEIRSDVARTGSFTSSNDLYNGIAEMAVHTIEQSMHGFPEDNPSRERRGWYADASLVSDLSVDTVDIAPIYANFVEDMVSGQMPNAFQPDGPPGMVFDHAQAQASAQYFFSDPAWGVAATTIPMANYRRTGDLRTLQQSYSLMSSYVDYLAASADAYLIKRLPSDHPWDDWTTQTLYVNDITQLDTPFFYLDVVNASAAASALGRTADVTRFDALATQIKSAYNTAYLTASSSTYYAGTTMIMQALPIVVGLVPDAQRTSVGNRLAALLAANSGQMSGGILSSRYVVEALALTGRGDSAATMMAAETKITNGVNLGYMFRQGPGTVWEQFQTPSSERIQPALGSMATWFYEGLAGIRATQPGSQRMSITPEVVAQATSADASVATTYGELSSRWQTSSGGLDYSVDIPTGVTADITLPAPYKNLLVTEVAATPTIVWTDGAAHLSGGITNVNLSGTTLTMTLASGRYHFQLSSGPAAQLSFIDDNDLRIAYNGDFHSSTGLPTASYSNGTVQSGTGSATFGCVSCTQLAWLSDTGPARGIAAVSVDGLPSVLVDLYTATAAVQRIVWASGPLAAGPHTVRISGAGKNPLSTSAVIEVDAIGLTGTPGPIPTIIDDTDQRFSYVGFAAYTGLYPNLYIGGDVHTSVRKAQATFSCASCTSIALVSPTSPARGIIQISIDGGPAATVDLFTTAPFYERTVFVSPLLANGPHTMTIYSAGKNPSSASGTFEIDGVRLVGT